MKALNRIAALAALAGAFLAAPAQAQNQTVYRFVVAPQGNEARYLVREQLARMEFPNDAVGATTGIGGGIVVDAAGRVDREQSRITIDMAALKTDSDRRDNYVRRNTLETEKHPTAVFAPTSFRNLTFPLAAGDVAFQIAGDLTIRGVTRPVVWDVSGRVENGAITGVAKTQFTFADFEMTKPRVASVLSVADEIRLEYSFFFVPQR